MPLEFHGVAASEATAQAVRFIGYSTKARLSAGVICEVTHEALRLLSQKYGSDELIFNFADCASLVFEIASAKFDEGSFRPRVTAHDVLSLLI